MAELLVSGALENSTSFEGRILAYTGLFNYPEAKSPSIAAARRQHTSPVQARTTHFSRMVVTRRLHSKIVGDPRHP